MTKQDFLDRMSNAYDMGLTDSKLLKHSKRMIDAMHRLEGGQIEYFVEFMVDEQKRTRHFSNSMQLANDTLGYNCIRLMAILVHPCQKCAVDPEAWHTRAGFCNHKEEI